MTEEKKAALLEEGLAHLGEPIDGKLKQYAESTLTGYLWRSRLIGRHVRRYMCSLCGAEFETDDRDEECDIYCDFPVTWKLRHDDRLECPACQRGLTVYDAWRSINRVETVFCEQWRKSAVDRNALVAVGAKVWIAYREAWSVPEPYINLLSFAVMKYGRRGTRYIKDGLEFRTAYKLADLSSGFVRCRRTLDEASVGEAVSGTPYDRVWNDAFLYASPQYGQELTSPLFALSWLGRHPAAEYVLKLGFVGLIADKLKDRYSTCRGINWDGKSMEEVMGLDRATVRQLRPYAMDLHHDGLTAFLELTKLIPEWPVQMRMECIIRLRLSYALKNYEGLCRERGYRLKDELKYMQRQIDKADAQLSWVELRDYWSECDKLNVPTGDYRTRHPKNLQEAHTAAEKRVRYIENREHDAKIAELAGAYDERYGFAACGLILRCAVSSREVIDEGSALRHCVGGYVARYAKGDTLIMVLRKTDEPDKPWHTVEMTPDGRVVQCRGYGNHTRPEEKGIIGAFWAAWEAEMERRKGRIRAKTA